MDFIIDRFEGDFAVCEGEDRKMIDIKKELIPKGAKEGDVLRIVGNQIIRDITATKKRKKEIQELTKDLFAE